jgi:hypothetical protein
VGQLLSERATEPLPPPPFLPHVTSTHRLHSITSSCHLYPPPPLHHFLMSPPPTASTPLLPHVTSTHRLHSITSSCHLHPPPPLHHVLISPPHAYHLYPHLISPPPTTSSYHLYPPPPHITSTLSHSHRCEEVAQHTHYMSLCTSGVATALS